MSLDLVLFKFLHPLAGQFQLFDMAVIFLAKYLPYLLVMAVIFFVLRHKVWKEKILVFITVALSLILSRGILTEVIRFFYDRPRPFEALNFTPLFLDSNPSFPSGHAAFFFALAFAVFYFNRKWGSWFLIFAFVNSLARVISGVHWPSDILGGIGAALFSFGVVYILLKPLISASSHLLKGPS